MATSQIFFVVGVLVLSGAFEVAAYEYRTEYFDALIDQFSFVRNDTYPMKFLVNDTYWNKEQSGPIFFYTGNEGAIELFAENTGFMWDIAPEFGAALVFAEHRYYGTSLPFGNKSYQSPEKLGYLSSEQAMADFAQFLIWFKQTRNATSSPIISFGGSYGGMLTAWMRMKYPHVIQGGIAGSAPIWQFQGLTPCNTFSKIVSSVFKNASDGCDDFIRKTWSIFRKFGETSSGREWISKTWKLCNPLKDQTDLNEFLGWLVDIYGNLAMINYPYPTSFLEPVPGFPIKEVCKRLPLNMQLKEKEILISLFKGLSVYFNYTRSTKCINTNVQQASNLGDLGWDFQACTEMVMPMCSDGVTDMFEPSKWSLSDFEAQCFKKWKVTSRPAMAEMMYGGRDIRSASNIVFSNGLLDPWSGGGVLKTLSDSLISVIIPEGAHHLDLRSANENDPPSVIAARNLEKNYIRRWIKEYKEN